MIFCKEISILFAKFSECLFFLRINVIGLTYNETSSTCMNFASNKMASETEPTHYCERIFTRL